MVRKQVYIEPEQEELLKQRARELGVSEAELVRRCIGHVGRVAAVVPFDLRAWQDELAFIRQRARMQHALGSQRRWTREELYEERLERFSR
jgi:hypothetical protein